MKTEIDSHVNIYYGTPPSVPYKDINCRSKTCTEIQKENKKPDRYCKECGAYVPVAFDYCPACGNDLLPGSSPNQPSHREESQDVIDLNRLCSDGRRIRIGEYTFTAEELLRIGFDIVDGGSEIGRDISGRLYREHYKGVVTIKLLVDVPPKESRIATADYVMKSMWRRKGDEL